MAAAAHSPEFAKKVGIPVKVAKEFNKADTGRKFGKGGEMKESKAMVKKEIEFMKKKGAPAKMIKHEEQEMKTKKMAKGGMSMPPAKETAAALNALKKRMAPGKAARRPAVAPSMPGVPMPTMKKGGVAHSDIAKDKPMMKKVAKEEVKSHEKKMHGMKSGGFVRSADGIAVKGKTRGTEVKMASGGMAKKKYC